MKLRRFEKTGASFTEDFRNGVDDLTSRGFITNGAGAGLTEFGPGGLPAVNLNSLSLTLAANKSRPLTHVDSSIFGESVFSVFFWFKTNNGNAATIISKQLSSTNNHYTIDYDGTNIVASVSSGGVSGSVTSSKTIIVGQWHFVCFSYGTYDGFTLNVDEIQNTVDTIGVSDLQESNFEINPDQENISLAQFVFYHKHFVEKNETDLLRSGRIFDYDTYEMSRYDFSTVNPRDVSNRGLRINATSSNITGSNIINARKNQTKALRFRGENQGYSQLINEKIQNSASGFFKTGGGVTLWFRDLGSSSLSMILSFATHKNCGLESSESQWSLQNPDYIFNIKNNGWNFFSYGWYKNQGLSQINGIHLHSQNFKVLDPFQIGSQYSPTDGIITIGARDAGVGHSTVDVYDLRFYDQYLSPIQQRDLYARTR